MTLNETTNSKLLVIVGEPNKHSGKSVYQQKLIQACREAGWTVVIKSIDEINQEEDIAIAVYDEMSYVHTPPHIFRHRRVEPWQKKRGQFTY